MDTHKLWKKLLAEFIGVFFLTFSVELTKGNPLNAAYTLIAFVTMGGPISGGHLNPALSLGVWIATHNTPHGFSVGDLFGYMVTHFFAGFVGALCSWGIGNTTFVLVPVDGVYIVRAVFAESLTTFSLVFVVLVITHNMERHMKNMLHKNLQSFIVGSVVGFTIYGLDSVVGGVSGGCFNPAVAFGPMLPHQIRTGEVNHWKTLWVYLVGTFGGGILAGYFFSIVMNWPEATDGRELLQAEKEEAEMAQQGGGDGKIAITSGGDAEKRTGSGKKDKDDDDV